MSQQGRIKSHKQLRMRPSQNQQGGAGNRQQTRQQQQDMGAHPAYGKQVRSPDRKEEEDYGNRGLHRQAGTTKPTEAQTRRETKGNPPQR